MMSAAVYHQYGAPEVLQLESVPKPAMGENDVSIRVYYSTVTRTDCGFLRATNLRVKLLQKAAQGANLRLVIGFLASRMMTMVLAAMLSLQACQATAW